VGYAFCPQDAVPEVRAAADFVTSSRAGEGAVREACERLLSRTNP
jgi:3-deoxy-D-manno-octulosonate 8-phosphate phosphatase KdsC-like HAD superfamily phosphatase